MALFCTQHQPLPIHVNAAAFQDYVMRFAAALDYRSELPELEVLVDPIRKLVVMLPVGILGPCVEAPVCECDAFLVPDKDWPGVARPDAVGGPNVKLHAPGLDVAALQDFTRGLFLARRSDDQVYIFMARNGADDVGKDPRNGVEFSRPV